ncbi:hypothetical protein [Salinarimonas soli]|uniref:HEPN domain-containing protein n=1 Tax=Salinarimonas soli TaxID=1638099 RepID=A0A5B2V750_9HYPH|nr:hypothetical protein [Salinarimonas soli]KAA2234791.1 hypothetical protein F0L46_22850 [Salinarimonas soli]
MTVSHWIEQIGEAVTGGAPVELQAHRILDAAAQLTFVPATLRQAEALVQLQFATLKLVGVLDGDARLSHALTRVVTAWFTLEREWSACIPPEQHSPAN